MPSRGRPAPLGPHPLSKRSCPRSGFLVFKATSIPYPGIRVPRIGIPSIRVNPFRCPSCFSILSNLLEEFSPREPSLRCPAARPFGEPKLRHPRNRFTAHRAPASPSKSTHHQPSSRFAMHCVHALCTSPTLYISYRLRELVTRNSSLRCLKKNCRKLSELSDGFVHHLFCHRFCSFCFPKWCALRAGRGKKAGEPPALRHPLRFPPAFPCPRSGFHGFQC